MNPTETHKKRRWPRYLFLAVNVLFLLWIILGSATNTHATNCQSLDQQTCQSAYDTGKAIGVGVIIFLWVAFDVIVGMILLVMKGFRR